MLSRKLYYLVKPFFSRRVQIAFRRFHASRVLRQCGGFWPINPAAGRIPDGWPGWPDGKEFGLILTHDVEGECGVHRVKQLAELEMKLGFRSSFNFVPEGGYTVPPGLRTWLTDRGFEVGVQDLHHDAKLYRSRQHFSESARRINHYLKQWDAVGFRSAFMLHNLEWLHDLNIAYDASTFDTDPFEPQPDGMDTIFPFWVRETRNAVAALYERRGRWGKAESGKQKAEIRRGEDRGQTTEDGAVAALYGRRQAEDGGEKAEPSSAVCSRITGAAANGSNGASRERGYVELPYTLVQDFNLFIILGATTIDTWTRKLDWIAQHGGMVLLDTHPDYMAFAAGKRNPVEYPVEFYKGLLEYVRSKYRGAFWHALPRDAAAYVVKTERDALEETPDPVVMSLVPSLHSAFK